MPEPYRHPTTVRYLEVDQQGVVFNMWYLAYFDDALTGFLEHRGLPYQRLWAAGVDLQLVHSEIDWRGGLRWQTDVGIEVALARLGRTSFTLDFVVRQDGVPVVTGRTVYVVVATDGGGKRPVPPLLLDALGRPEPLLPLGGG